MPKSLRNKISKCYILQLWSSRNKQKRTTKSKRSNR